jgi:hypothetical protein
MTLAERILDLCIHGINAILDGRIGRAIPQLEPGFAQNLVRWIAVDPKGVIGEIEYEIGASLRNPYENPEIFASA